MAPKHSRSGSESDDDEDIRFIKLVRSDSNSASSLATFVDLPFELRTTILDLASQRRLKSGEAVSGSEARERLRLDYGTLFALSLTSRELNGFVSPLLWRHVKITRPSALFEFRQALIHDPSKAELVKSLHVGPVRALPKGWWPARYKDPDQHDALPDEPIDLLKTSLGKWDEELLPRWCKPAKEWAYSLPPRTCQGGAINKIIYAALQAVRVGVGHPDMVETFGDSRGGYLGINEWTVRMFELQGVLDLYLAAMRRIEDEEGRSVASWRAKKSHPTPRDSSECRNGQCGHYPTLVLEGFEGSKKASSKKAPTSESSTKTEQSKQKSVVITRDQVRHHLQRRGALTDSFEHPLLFARSGVRALSTDYGGTVEINHDEARPSDDFYGTSDSEDEYHSYGEYYRHNDDNFSSSSASSSPSSHSSTSISTADDSNDSFDLSQRGGIVALCRSVLHRLPTLENLSLTGFLHLSFGRSPPAFDKLLCLSLGPPTCLPACIRSLDSLRLPAVKKLRLCADYLGSDVAKRISGLTAGWESLRETRWDYGASSDYDRYPSVAARLCTTLHYLQGYPRGAHPTESHQAASEEASLPHDDPTSPHSRYTEVRLKPTRVSATLAAAFSADVRTSWLEGTIGKNAPHRVRLLQSPAYQSEKKKSRSASQIHAFHCQESEQWWEECAWAIERGEQVTSK